MNCSRILPSGQSLVGRKLLSALVLFLAIIAGCEPNQKDDREEKPAEQPKTSEVPLRIWVVADLERVDLFKRQWLAGSDQPIEITPLSIEELLKSDTCNCDVILYPARLLGEIQNRGWIGQLPKALQTADAPPDSWTPFDSLPQPLREQAEYDALPYALPLGQTSCVVLYNGKPNAEVASWQQIQSSLMLAPTDQEDDFAVELDAVVDRFLAIATSLSERDAKYGLLFDLRPFASRLTEAEFLEAAQTLFDMQGQPNGRFLVRASHSKVWSANGETGLFAIASPAATSAEPVEELLPVADISPAIRLNTGLGLNASVATLCRQTAQSIEFIKWLSSPSTRTALSSTIDGITSNKPSDDPRMIDAQRIIRKSFASRRRCLELRLPGVEQYRSALGKQLLRYLDGELDARAALEQANADWQSITKDLGAEKQLSEYRKSLGLTQ